MMKPKVCRTTLALVLALSLLCGMACAEEASAQFVQIATLDLNNEATIAHEKELNRQTAEGELRYYDYNGDLLSIVDDPNAACGKAVQVASATDFPRTVFSVESGVVYQFSYKIKLTDASKFDTSFGISPYINFAAANENGEMAYDNGFDFHRNYADVVYAYTDEYIETNIWFTTTEKKDKILINLYDSYENVLAENERDSFKFPAGYLFLNRFEVAFYTQGMSKTMPYTISDISLSANGVTVAGTSVDEEEDTVTVEVMPLTDEEAESMGLVYGIIADASATDSASNPGKLVVNHKSDFLSLVADAEAACGAAIQVKDATDFPRIRFNTLETGKAYKVSYAIKMTDESAWHDGDALGISPYLDFTTYSPELQNWNTGEGGYDFHCGYKDVQYTFNGAYKYQEFCFSTELTNEGLVLKLFADSDALAAGNASVEYTFIAGYTQLAAVDMAFYRQGGAAYMPYRIADLTVAVID